MTKIQITNQDILYQDINHSLSYTLKQVCYFCFDKHKKCVMTLITLLIIIGIAPSIDGIFIQHLTDLIENYSDERANQLFSGVFKWAIIYVLWWESLNMLWRFYDFVYLKTMPKIKIQVVEEFFEYVSHHSHEFFQNNLAGDITNRITEASRSFEMVFHLFSEKILRRFAVVIFAVFTMYNVNHIIAGIFSVWVIIFVGMSLFFARRVNHYSSIYGKKKARVAGKIVDAIANISSVRMFTSYQHERKYMQNHLVNAKRSDQNLQWFVLKLSYALGVSCTALIFCMLYYILKLRSQLLISIGDCVLIISLAIAVIQDVWDLTEEFGELFEQVGIFSQSLSLFYDQDIVDKKGAKELVVKKPIIEFKNVTFEYQNNNNIFKNLSVTIDNFQKVGLVGFSGSGKTTFTNLITRLYEIEKGKILIDGQDIKEVTQKSLRRNITIIPQEPILFHRSIMENIRYGNFNATDKEVYEAAKKAYIHSFIMKLPEGYNTNCGERGSRLSGGQRQRIMIARAILRGAPILIFDEVTSALDSHTEKLIHKSLVNLMKDKIVLVIAHKLSTLYDMDRILVFDNGHIVEDGTHKELKKSGKLYQELWQSQVQGILAG